jgi:hypothetical protein
MPFTLLMRRGDIEREYGLTRHEIDKAASERKLPPYRGPAATQHRTYFRADVLRYVAARQAAP